MDTPKLLHALEKLTTDALGKNKTKQIESLLPYIEAAIYAGASHEKILAVLKAQGMDVELEYFRVILYRLRKKIAGRKNVLKKLHLPQQSQNEQEEDKQHVQSGKKTVYPLNRKDVAW